MKGIAIMIGGPKKGAPPEDSGGDDGMDVDAEARRSAVRDLFDAMKSNDVEAGVSALGEFLKCGPPDDAAEEASESPDEAASEDNGTKDDKPARRGMYRD